MTHHRAHPYMANSTEEAKAHMLAAIGIEHVDELFEQIPDEHRTRHVFELPPALSSEVALKRHLSEVLARNRHTEENLSFLGAGIWQHHVPAVCDEVWTRSEFLTSVWGTPSSDLGRNQAFFEFQSQLGELVDMEFVGLPVYSWGAAVGHALRMAARISGRDRVLVPARMDPQRLGVARTYAGVRGLAGSLEIVTAESDTHGRLDIADLRSKLDDGVAAVYFENPAYLGMIEDRGAEIADLTHGVGAELIVGVDPISLGIIAPPSQYGADIVVGTTQPLGVHMNCGGGVGGFIATRDETRYAHEYPTLQVSPTDTIVEGEMGFGMALFEQSSYGAREEGNDWTGNSVYLWAIANAVYMSLMGPTGFRELGELVIARSHYAAQRIAGIPGVSVKWQRGFFKEFVVDFSATGHTVGEVNRRLLEHGIFGGKDLSADFPDLGQCALYCVTEIHHESDIDRLIAALAEVTR